MISTETSKFSKTLSDMLMELKNYHRNRSDLMFNYVQQRLNKSLETYYHDIVKTFEYLNYRNEDNLIKKYERVMK